MDEQIQNKEVESQAVSQSPVEDLQQAEQTPTVETSAEAIQEPVPEPVQEPEPVVEPTPEPAPIDPSIPAEPSSSASIELNFAPTKCAWCNKDINAPVEAERNYCSEMCMTMHESRL